MTIKRLVTSVLALTGLAGNCLADSQARWAHLSDALALGLPVLAVSYSVQHDDSEGARQLAWTLGSTLLSTEILKSRIQETRPDSSANDSMPSGHTAIAFATARSLQMRYNDAVNPWLLYGAASLTALARVNAEKHYWKDTIAGAALGVAWGSYFTEGINGERLTLLPMHQGVAVAWTRNW